MPERFFNTCGAGLVRRFGGEHWDDMGGGLAYTPNPYAGAALDLEWWRGHLLVSGRFNTASDIECSGIIKWNGNQWCSFPGGIQTWSGIYSRIPEMAIWRDLYICGNISTIDSDTVQQVAQWIGGDAVGYCSSPVGMAEAPGRPAALEAVQSGDAQWRIRFPQAGHWALSVHNAAGQSLGTWQAKGEAMVLDLRDQAPGLYLLRATGPAGTVRSAKVMRP